MLALAIILFVLLPAALFAYACCVVSGNCSREEEEHGQSSEGKR